ncbi:MFS transporter [Streptomyces sp. TM32]|uniref:MFS transporter n=1 Tax=Streptomyces sp. TM32 TaxID=1652669 RepID=UPI0010104035|nr:MFS transporter [Streptomyces sp. TM32]RXS84644.1 MFS transporter [Streptomyces sp. TM32]
MHPPTTSAPRARAQLPPHVYLLALGTFFIGTDVFAIAGMLPALSASLDVSLSAAGQLMTVFSLSYAVLGPVLSTVLSRWSPRTCVTGALCAVAAGNLVCAGAPSLMVAFLGRVLVAAGACQFTPHVAALAAASVTEQRRGRALAVVNGGLVAGSVIGVPASTWAAEATNWRISLTLLGLGTAVVASALVSGLRGHAECPRPMSLREQLGTLRSPQVRLLLSVTALAVVAEYSLLTYAGAVFAPATGHDGGRLGLLLLVFGVGGLVGNSAAGAFLDRPMGRHLVLLSLAGMAVAFLVMPWTTTCYPAALVCVALWGIAGWMYATPQQHRLLRQSGPAGPLAVSVNSSVIYLGGAAGGALGGALLAWLPDHWTPLPAAALCALAVVPELLFRRREPVTARPIREPRPTPR